MDGIKINDAAVEISPSGLQSLLNKQGAELKVTRLDLSISPEALNTLLTSLAPQGQPAPTAQVAEGQLQLSGERDGQRMALDLHTGGFRLEFTAQGLRLVSDGGVVDNG